MNIITLTKEQFDSFASKHKYGSFYQSSQYGEFSKTNDHYEVHYLGFKDRNNNLVGASMMLYKTLFWGYKFAYAPRGFLIDYDNVLMINNIISSIKKLLKSQKYIFITIDPPVVLAVRDKAGNIIQTNNNVNMTLNSFKKNGFEHLGFNLYDESILPRWNVLAPLVPDARILYNNVGNEIKEKINYANNICLKVTQDTTYDINKLYELTKNKYNKKGIRYFQNLFSAFSNYNRIKIFYAVIDTKKYTENANRLYEKEEENNNRLANIIQSESNFQNNMQSIINEKIESDKMLHLYKKDVVASTKILKTNPEGLVCGVALVIEEGNGVNIIVNQKIKEYERYNADILLNYEIMKYYGKEGYKYINLGSITGNFDTTSKYYSLLLSKIGFNSSIIEYIGQFNIILNPLMYKIYLHKKNNQKKP